MRPILFYRYIPMYKVKYLFKPTYGASVSSCVKTFDECAGSAGARLSHLCASSFLVKLNILITFIVVTSHRETKQHFLQKNPLENVCL